MNLKTIVSGSRTINDKNLIFEVLNEAKLFWNNDNIIEIVSGTAKGVDIISIEYAIKNNIPYREFPAQWDKYGKSAGYKRNEEMGSYGNSLISIWDGSSRGSFHMIKYAIKKKMKIFVFSPKNICIDGLSVLASKQKTYLIDLETIKEKYLSFLS